MTEKQMNYLGKIKEELQSKIEFAYKRKKQERKAILIQLQKIIDSMTFETNTFSVLVEIYEKGFSNNTEWQNYIWQNTVLQQHPDFEWIKILGKKEI